IDTRFDSNDLTVLVEAAARLSRTAFPEALKRAGYRDARAHANGEAAAAGPVPERIERELEELETLSQFVAVRQLHQRIAQDGPSPELLGALVRGYANLGSLTEFHWNAVHKAFKARALLYAQRMTQADPQSTWALWHRAYARALAGLHKA